MNCPKCKKAMKGRRFFINTFFSDWTLLELLLPILVVPIMMAGIIGWAISSVLFISVVVFSWGKRWYKCKECGYTTVMKLNSIQP